MKTSKLIQAAKKLDRFFNAAKGPSELEPHWLHPFHEAVRQIAAGIPVEGFEDEVIIDMATKIGTRNVPFTDGVCPPRVLDDGWKQGTATWVFLGRQTSPFRKRIKDLVVIARPLPDGRLVYIAYHLTEPMGMTAMTSNVVGPSENLAVVEYHCNQEATGKFTA